MMYFRICSQESGTEVRRALKELLSNALNLSCGIFFNENLSTTAPCRRQSVNESTNHYIRRLLEAGLKYLSKQCELNVIVVAAPEETDIISLCASIGLSVLTIADYVAVCSLHSSSPTPHPSHLSNPLLDLLETCTHKYHDRLSESEKGAETTVGVIPESKKYQTSINQSIHAILFIYI